MNDYHWKGPVDLKNVPNDVLTSVYGCPYGQWITVKYGNDLYNVRYSPDQGYSLDSNFTVYKWDPFAKSSLQKLLSLFRK